MGMGMGRFQWDVSDTGGEEREQSLNQAAIPKVWKTPGDPELLRKHGRIPGCSSTAPLPHLSIIPCTDSMQGSPSTPSVPWIRRWNCVFLNRTQHSRAPMPGTWDSLPLWAVLPTGVGFSRLWENSLGGSGRFWCSLEAETPENPGNGAAFPPPCLYPLLHSRISTAAIPWAWKGQQLPNPWNGMGAPRSHPVCAFPPNSPGSREDSAAPERGADPELLKVFPLQAGVGFEPGILC